jgi:hypothetical protein
LRRGPTPTRLAFELANQYFHVAGKKAPGK